MIAILITAKSKVLKRWKAIDGRYSVFDSFCKLDSDNYIQCLLYLRGNVVYIKIIVNRGKF